MPSTYQASESKHMSETPEGPAIYVDGARRETAVSIIAPTTAEPRYAGYGTLESPYVVDWGLEDPENPYNWRQLRKWQITFQASRNLIELGRMMLIW